MSARGCTAQVWILQPFRISSVNKKYTIKAVCLGKVLRDHIFSLGPAYGSKVFPTTAPQHLPSHQLFWHQLLRQIAPAPAKRACTSLDSAAIHRSPDNKQSRPQTAGLGIKSLHSLGTRLGPGLKSFPTTVPSDHLPSHQLPGLLSHEIALAPA